MNSNMERARQNEDQVLLAVGMVGWLTTAQAAAWAWPASGEHSARNRAAEVLARLRRRRLLMRRQTPLGTWAYLLTNAGAARANASFEYEVCRNGYDLSQLDVYRQAQIVAHLVAQKGAIRMGPAGVRGAVRCGLVEDAALREADALTWDPDLSDWAAAMVTRTLHQEMLAKARRLRAAAGRLELLGPAALVRKFAQEMNAKPKPGAWTR